MFLYVLHERVLLFTGFSKKATPKQRQYLKKKLCFIVHILSWSDVSEASFWPNKSNLFIVIIITQLEFSRLIHLDLNKGDLWLLVAMLSWAIYSTMLKTHKTGLNYLTFISVIVTLGLIFLFPQFLFELNNHELIKFNFAFFLIISYVVLFAGLGAYIFWNKAVLIVGPSRAGIFLHLMPVFSSFMAIFLLNEKFMNFHIFGAIAIILGIYLSSRKKSLSWKLQF